MQTEKLYENDAYLRSFTAKVLSCEPLADAKKRSDGAAYGVILDRIAPMENLLDLVNNQQVLCLFFDHHRSTRGLPHALNPIKVIRIYIISLR